MTHTVRLPENWASTCLGEVAPSVRPRSKPQEHPELRFIGMDNVEAHTMRLLGTVPASELKSSATHFQPGDVLYGRLRPYLNKVITVDFEGLASAEFIPLSPPDGILPELLKYRLNTVEFVAFTSKLDTGDRPRVDYDQISTFEFGLPPTREQHRIVEAIESYLTRLDDAVASLQRVQRNLERYRASVLKAAVEGRLVPTEAELARREGRDYEPADVLLERILAERKARWIEDAAEKARGKAEAKALKVGKPWAPEDNAKALEKARKTAEAKYKEPESPDTTDLPVLPEGWCWTRAEQVCNFITKGTTPAKDQMSAHSGDVPFIKVYNLTFDGSLDFSVDPTFVNCGTHTGSLARSITKPGDVLINIVGPPLGKTALVPNTFAEWNINQAIARFRPVPGLVSEYLEFVLRSKPFVEWAVRKSKATAGQFNLTLEICRDAPVPLPPTTEQERIADELAARASSEQTAAHSVARSLGMAALTRQAILKWAFEGKLIEQDPNDEPAVSLLERIRAKREPKPESRRMGRK